MFPLLQILVYLRHAWRKETGKKLFYWVLIFKLRIFRVNLQVAVFILGFNYKVINISFDLDDFFIVILNIENCWKVVFSNEFLQLLKLRSVWELWVAQASDIFEKFVIKHVLFFIVDSSLIHGLDLFGQDSQVSFLVGINTIE